LSRIGPDLLDPQLTQQDILKRLQEKRFCGRSLAALYLDQHFLAGLGNYLRSEILFAAAVHPMQRPAELETTQLQCLSKATLELAWRSYRTRGITLSKGQHEDVRRAGRRGEAARFWVFARAGQPCYRCTTTLQRESRSGRRIYLCPSCQSK
jgi:endonuclease-8